MLTAVGMERTKPFGTGHAADSGVHGPATIGGISLPAELRRHGSALLNQQFWLWGQDIRRPDGNSLLVHGFERERPPEGVNGSRAYSLDLGGGRSLRLWGFGLFHGDPTLGGIYVSRFRLTPLLTESPTMPPGIWMPSQLPERHAPSGSADWASALPLLVATLRWIAAYERWAQAAQGLARRRETLGR